VSTTAKKPCRCGSGRLEQTSKWEFFCLGCKGTVEMGVAVIRTARYNERIAKDLAELRGLMAELRADSTAQREYLYSLEHAATKIARRNDRRDKASSEEAVWVDTATASRITGLKPQTLRKNPDRYGGRKTQGERGRWTWPRRQLELGPIADPDPVPAPPTSLRRRRPGEGDKLLPVKRAA
jgi:hypothetical protein